jgi:hypothetical protein
MLRITLVVLMAALSSAHAAADVNALAGNWVGEVDSDRGQMEIALSLTLMNGTLTGTLRTGHGDWPIAGVAEKDGLFTIDLKTPEGPGRMIGRVKGTMFSGEWHAPKATGTFELTRARARPSIS